MIQKWGEPQMTMNLWTKILFSMSEKKLQELVNSAMCRSFYLVLALTQVLCKPGSPMPNLISWYAAQCLCPLYPGRLVHKVKTWGKIIFATALLVPTEQDWGCKSEWIVLQILRRENGISHVDGQQQPDSDIFCNKSPQWWNKARSEILEQYLFWGC